MTNPQRPLELVCVLDILLSPVFTMQLKFKTAKPLKMWSMRYPGLNYFEIEKLCVLQLLPKNLMVDGKFWKLINFNSFSFHSSRGIDVVNSVIVIHILKALCPYWIIYHFFIAWSRLFKAIMICFSLGESNQCLSSWDFDILF